MTPQPARGDGRARLVLVEVAWAAGVAVAALLALALVIHLWDAALRVPFDYSGDANLTMVGVRNMMRTGWYLRTDLLGAPFGQNLSDFPAIGDLGNLLGLRILSAFTSDPGLVINAFWLGSFPLVAAVSYLSLRGLRIGRVSAATAALVFTFVPYHFQRGEAHLFLAAYWGIPLASLLLVRQAGPDPLVDLGGRGTPLFRRLVRPGVLGGAALCVAVACSGLYYAVFTAALLGVCMLVALVGRRWGAAAGSAAAAAVVLGTVAVQALPSALYQRQHGPNPEAVVRTYGGVEFYGLKLVNLVMPVVGHRVPYLANLKLTTYQTTITGEAMETLGLVATVGFLGLLVVALAGLVSRSPRDPRLGALAMLTVASLLMGTIAGFSAVLAAFGFDEIRAWNRISILIAFFALAAVAIGLDAFWRRTPNAARVLPMLGGAALVVFAVLDQTTVNFRPPFATTAKAWNNDQRFVDSIARTLGPDAAVFQMPILRFPENGSTVDMVDYDLARPYLHNGTLRWSYGGVKGREAEWQTQLIDRPLPDVVRDVIAAGFTGLYVDRYGYADRGAALEKQLQSLLGEDPLVSDDGRMALYDLRPYRATLVQAEGETGLAERGKEVLLAIVPTSQGGCSPQETNGQGRWIWCGPSGRVHLANPTGVATTVTVTFGAASAAPGSHQLVVQGDRGATTLTISQASKPVELTVDVPPGGTDLDVSSDAPPVQDADARDLRFRLDQLSVAPPSQS